MSVTASELYLEPVGPNAPHSHVIRAVTQCGPKGRQNLNVAILDVSNDLNPAIQFLGRDGFTSVKLAESVIEFLKSKPWIV